jgi:hypothetical protein
VQNVVLFV